MPNQPVTWSSDTWTKFLDPSPFVEVRDAWFSAIRRSFGQGHFPLSGDVTQFIRAWGQLFTQVGLINVNSTNSSDPETEERITTHYSYGKQLGRIVEMLAPYVREHAEEFGKAPGAKRTDVDDFLAMATEIAAWKPKRGMNPGAATR